MEPIVAFLILLAGLIGGFYGTLVGAGSLITVPAVLYSGLSPLIAIATNRFASLAYQIPGIYKFGKNKLIDFKLGFTLSIFYLIGAVIGIKLVFNINEATLKKIIAITILIILFFIIFSKNKGIEKRKRKTHKIEWITGNILIFFLGIYSGFFGAGTGTLLSYFLIFFFGQTFLESAGTRKIPNLITSILVVTIFLLNKKIDFLYGSFLFTGVFIGSYIGSHYAPKIGNIWLRRLFIVAVIIMSLGLLIK